MAASTLKALGRGLALYILRYADELREPAAYFEGITAEPDPQAVKLAANRAPERAFRARKDAG